MAEYLHHLMTDMFAEFVEIPPTTWITIYVFFTLFWLIVELTNDLVLLCAFLTVPYWLLLLLTKVSIVAVDVAVAAAVAAAVTAAVTAAVAAAVTAAVAAAVTAALAVTAAVCGDCDGVAVLCCDRAML